MLYEVFKDLSNQGILIFLDTTNYVTNAHEWDDEWFSNAEKFLEMYTSEDGLPPKGWIWSKVTSIDDIISTIKMDSCSYIEYGFNSNTNEKALEVGRSLVNSLNKSKFIAQWNERALVEKTISTVVTIPDFPEEFQHNFEVKYTIE